MNKNKTKIEKEKKSQKKSLQQFRWPKATSRSHELDAGALRAPYI
jgi:hypothetical protein